jgi:hypothetical protein
MDNDGADEEAIELVPGKGKKRKRIDFRNHDVAFGAARDNQEYRREVHMLSARPGAGLKCQMVLPRFEGK